MPLYCTVSASHIAPYRKHVASRGQKNEQRGGTHAKLAHKGTLKAHNTDMSVCTPILNSHCIYNTLKVRAKFANLLAKTPLSLCKT